VLGRLGSHNILVALNTIKDPLSSVPEELWQLMEREVGSFPARLQDLLRAFSSDQVPPFLDLLKVFCGGTLLHKCSFCSANLTVAALEGEVKGSYYGVSTVLLEPHLPLLFACSATSCRNQMFSQMSNWSKWAVAVKTTYYKLMRCDYCFKRAEQVHRCGKCYTKNYCSKECLAQDWEVKHQGFCSMDANKRKAKGGYQVRFEKEMKQLEQVFAGVDTFKISDDSKKETMEVAEMCKKMTEKKINSKVLKTVRKRKRQGKKETRQSAKDD